MDEDEAVPEIRLVDKNAEIIDSDVTVKGGEAVTFYCEVKNGHPEPRILFYKNGKLLQTNENVSIGKSPERSDSMEYAFCK